MRPEWTRTSNQPAIDIDTHQLCFQDCYNLVYLFNVSEWYAWFSLFSSIFKIRSTTWFPNRIELNQMNKNEREWLMAKPWRPCNLLFVHPCVQHIYNFKWPWFTKCVLILKCKSSLFLAYLPFLPEYFRLNYLCIRGRKLIIICIYGTYELVHARCQRDLFISYSIRSISLSSIYRILHPFCLQPTRTTRRSFRGQFVPAVGFLLQMSTELIRIWDYME